MEDKFTKTLYSSQSVDSLVNEMKPLMQKIEAGFENGVAIYGAGFVGTWAVPYLKSIGANVTCFFDRDEKKNGSTICDIPVLTPIDENLANTSTMLIAARHAVKEVENSMQEREIDMLSFDGYYLVKNYDRFANVRDNYFNDERSVETFNALLIAMLSGSIKSCLDVMEKDMYFALPEFSGNFNEAFVDAGAFVGDTVERFIWENLGTFKHIHAFEPGYKQFRALEKRIDRLYEEWAIDKNSVSLVKAGLSDENTTMNCSYVDDSPLRHGLVAQDKKDISDDKFSSEVYTLDSYLDGKGVSFIKADVEGMELELLRGAKETIQRCKPKMALCAYHYPNDLFEIAEYVRELNPEYKFVLRQHAPIFGDFVLYCYI
ncbi:MAG: FkbM family methyltransferase [Campylobacterota bacterium]|nr:FkbM family methyltransferase [Campylobacterota bacterium]